MLLSGCRGVAGRDFWGERVEEGVGLCVVEVDGEDLAGVCGEELIGDLVGVCEDLVGVCGGGVVGGGRLEVFGELEDGFF